MIIDCGFFYILIKDAVSYYEFKNLGHARAVTDEIVGYYNEERLHIAINFLRPIDYHRGNPDKLLKKDELKYFKLDIEEEKKPGN